MNRAELSGNDTLLAKVISVLVCVAKGYILSVILLFLLALLVTYTPFDEKFTDSVVSCISIVSVVFSSICVARRYRTLGWLHGVITGICYNLILYVFSSVFLSFAGTQKSIVPFIVSGVVCGIIGGIIGVNLGRK